MKKAFLFSLLPFVSFAEPSWFPQFLGFKGTIVTQYSAPFTSPYSGPMSFGGPPSGGENGGGKSIETTQSYGIYLGSNISNNLKAYLDIQMFKGNGVGGGQGLGGYPNSLYIRAGSEDLGKSPYIARAFLIYYVPLSKALEKKERYPDTLEGYYPKEYVYFKAGKFSIADDFDNNTYANSPRTQFLNYDFNYNPAWDYGADTRGYTTAIETGIVKKSYSFKVALGAEPTKANGNTYDESGAYSLNTQLSIRPNESGSVIRILGMLNYGRMASYRQVLDNFNYYATVCENTQYGFPGYDSPLICAESRNKKHYKWGLFLNFEQPLFNDGKTGFFLRAGFNNGQTEDFAYTDVDRTISFGFSISGENWKRPKDNLGIGFAINGLSSAHKEYLTKGTSFMVGDTNCYITNGSLSCPNVYHYGKEKILEVYYRFVINNYVDLSPDFQFIDNPGYNKDRGPLYIYSLRLNTIF